MSDDDRFEELPDIEGELADYGDLDAALTNTDAVSDVFSGGFTELYTLVRNRFCENTKLLEQFGSNSTHLDRVKFLAQIQEVRTILEKISLLRPNPAAPSCSSPSQQNFSQWTEAPPLSYGANKKYPHLSKAVEVKSSADEGRYFSAVQKINPGDVLVVDRPYSSSLFHTHYSTHCLNCFRRLQEETALHCPSCNKVKFCSQTCLETCFNKTHRWECGVLELIDNEEIGRMATLAYRVVSLTGYEYLRGNRETLDSTPGSYTDGDYPSVYHQIDNMEKRPTGDHLKRCFTALLLARCLQLSCWFPEGLREDVLSEEFLFIASVLVKHIQSCACNAYEINEFVKKGASMINCDSVELGGAVYPTISLSNHSCTGNTSRTSYGTYCCVRATRTIYPNEKVYDNYGEFYHIAEKEGRQQRLDLQYFFHCACAACKNSWPLYRDFCRDPSLYQCPGCKYKLGNSIDKLKKCVKCKKELKGLTKLVNHLSKLQLDFRKIMDGITVENAKDYISTYSKLLAEVEKVYQMPCKEITECQQVLLQSYAVLGNHSTLQSTAAESQVALINQDVSEDDDDDDEDDDDIPGLI